MKKKLTIEEQIDHMKFSDNINFANYSDEKAIEFLTYHNYFFKLKSYSELFERIEKGIDRGKYKNLKFEQLVELSKIDLYLREIIFKISLSIEHSLKVQILRDISSNPDENGYDIVKAFLDSNSYVKQKLLKKACKHKYNKKNRKLETEYTPTIINDNVNNLSAWNLVDVIDFGMLESFYKFYMNYYYADEQNKLIDLLWNVRKIRNGCAHNSCLLVSLNKETKKMNHPFHILYLLEHGFKFNDTESNLLNKFLLKDVASLLISFSEIVTSVEVKKHIFLNLKVF